MNFMIYGEDNRHPIVAKLLSAAGHTEAAPADLFILSVRESFLPHKKDGKESCFVFGGIPSDQEKIKEAGFQKLSLSNTYRKKNSVYTAEGALALAITELPTALCETSVLVLGYGFLGKECSQLFRNAGAFVVVSTADQKEKEDAEKTGFSVLPLRNLSEFSASLILNTIPVPLFDNENLRVKKGYSPILLELASIPCCKEPIKNLKTVTGKALPSRFSPVSAASLMAKELLAAMPLLSQEEAAPENN